MTTMSLPAALIREHRDIDAGIEAFVADLDDDAAAELAEFLRTGSTPDGWICEAAP